MFRTLILAITAGCLAAPVMAQDVVLEDAWVRALPPVKKVTAAYLTVVNNSDRAVAVVAASADVAERVEIHRTREVDGFTRMEQVQGLAVAAGERVELAPGGTHLMLLGLEFMPEPGDTIELCLELGNGESVCTEAGTRKSANATDPHQHH